ncbi:glycosyltransferase family 2 protein [Salinibacter ruber]|uniref:glycosyltransferase family 2 protein n=1 Tax=Salinibacter ruber TaxID=146919 RepID=UPI002168FBD3|nr:glycosyltransferase family 2 protein [Salinibacter ruber]
MFETLPKLDKLPDPPSEKRGWPWTEQSDPLLETRKKGEPWPEISVVTPSYNQGRFIEETLRSVLLQGYPNLEYIVVDGGSTDETTEILDRYDPWIDHWVSEPDRGQTHAINKGFQRASSDAITWINSDDILLPGVLQAAASHLFDGEDCDAVFGHARLIDEQSATTGRYTAAPPDLRSMILRWHNPLPQQGFLMRRAVYEDCGPFDERLDFPMDLEYWIRCLRRGKTIEVIDRDLGGFRAHEASKTQDQHIQFTQDMVDVITRVRDETENETVQAWCDQSLRQRYYNAALNAYAWEQPRLVREYAWKDWKKRGGPALTSSVPYAVLSGLPNQGAWVRWLYLGIRRRLRELMPVRGRPYD